MMLGEAIVGEAQEWCSRHHQVIDTMGEAQDVRNAGAAVTRYYNGVIPGFFVNFDVRH